MKLVYLLFIPLLCSLNSIARNDKKSTSNTILADSISEEQVEYRFALGVQLGTDIGGAIPFPFSNVPDVFNPYPKLSPSIGAKLTFPIDRKWTLGAEVTYKKVAIDADARIDNQRFHDDKNNIISRAALLCFFCKQECPWISRCWKFLFILNTRSRTKRTVFWQDFTGLGLLKLNSVTR